MHLLVCSANGCCKKCGQDPEISCRGGRTCAQQVLERVWDDSREPALCVGRLKLPSLNLYYSDKIRT